MLYYIRLQFNNKQIILITKEQYNYTIYKITQEYNPFNQNNGLPHDNGYSNYENEYEKAFYILLLVNVQQNQEIHGGNQWIYSLNNTTDTNPFTESGQTGYDVGLQEDGKFLYLIVVRLVIAR